MSNNLINTHISEDAFVRTDNWSAYSALQNEYPNLEQIDSDEEKNFRELHINVV